MKISIILIFFIIKLRYLIFVFIFYQKIVWNKFFMNLFQYHVIFIKFLFFCFWNFWHFFFHKFLKIKISHTHLFFRATILIRITFIKRFFFTLKIQLLWWFVNFIQIICNMNRFIISNIFFLYIIKISIWK